MENSVAVCIDIEGLNRPILQTAQIVLQVPYCLDWADFYSKIATSLQIEQVSMDLNYYDEDKDKVILSSQEELSEAFKVAQMNKDVLHLTVKLYGETQDSTSITSPVLSDNIEDLSQTFVETAISTKNEEKSRHIGVMCDGCDLPIFGVRYKCGNCQDFDLCENCESLDSIHDPSHIFLKIRRPTRGLGIQNNGLPAPLLGTDVAYVLPTPEITPMTDIPTESLKVPETESNIPVVHAETETHGNDAQQSTYNNQDEGVGEWSLCSSLSDSDTEDSFYIVPLPNCFIPERPAETTSKTNVIVKKDDLLRSVDCLPVSSSSANVHGSTCEHDQVLSEQVASVLEKDSVSEDVLVLTSSSDSSEASIICITPEEHSGMSLDEEEHLGSLVVSQDRDEDVSYEEALSQDTCALDDALVSTPINQPESRSPLSRSASDLATSVLSSAMEAASTAAAAALTTAKDVFQTLQAQSKYVPPQSSYTPAQPTWVPTTEQYPYPPQQPAWTPPVEQYPYPPQEATWTHPTERLGPANTPMEKLVEMGFANRSVNAELLYKYRDNIDKVIEELLITSDSSWYDSRH